MTQVDKSAREKLILATIDCIENEGINALTIRRIADKAKVNSAAINYYFGSKENLIEETLEHTLNHALGDALEILERKDLDPYTALKTFFEYFFEGALLYSGIVKAHLHNPINHNDYKGPIFSWFNSVLDNLSIKLKSLYPEKNEKDIKLSITQIFSIILFQGLMPYFFSNFTDLNLKDSKTRKEYINYLLEKFFHSEP